MLMDNKKNDERRIYANDIRLILTEKYTSIYWIHIIYETLFQTLYILVSISKIL